MNLALSAHGSSRGLDYINSIQFFVHPHLIIRSIGKSGPRQRGIKKQPSRCNFRFQKLNFSVVQIKEKRIIPAGGGSIWTLDNFQVGGGKELRNKSCCMASRGDLKDRSFTLPLYLLINHCLNFQMRICPFFTQEIFYEKYIRITTAKINHWPCAK